MLSWFIRFFSLVLHKILKFFYFVCSQKIDRIYSILWRLHFLFPLATVDKYKSEKHIKFRIIWIPHEIRSFHVAEFQINNLMKSASIFQPSCLSVLRQCVCFSHFRVSSRWELQIPHQLGGTFLDIPVKLGFLMKIWKIQNWFNQLVKIKKIPSYKMFHFR